MLVLMLFLGGEGISWMMGEVRRYLDLVAMAKKQYKQRLWQEDL
jgi:hypothetical protein